MLTILPLLNHFNLHVFSAIPQHDDSHLNLSSPMMSSYTISEPIYWFIVNVVALLLGYLFAPVIIPVDSDKENRNNKYRHDDADLIASTPIYPLMIYYATKHIINHNNSVHGRWSDTSSAGYTYLWLYVMRGFVSFIAIFLGDAKIKDKLLMSFHHVVTIGCHLTTIRLGRLHWFVCLAGCFETSTIFLNIMLLFRKIQYKGFINTINGVVLWISFLNFRIILIPYVLYRFYMDVHYYPTETVANITRYEEIAYPATTLIVFAMSCHWFIIITRGMIKVIKTRQKTV